MKVSILLLALLWGTNIFAKDCVILIHGLARSTYSLKPLKNYLKKAGYQPIYMGYASTFKSITQSVETKMLPAINKCHNKENVHFVTHSLGGIVLRTFFSKFKEASSPFKTGRVVMMAPPNQKSHMAKMARKSVILRAIIGPAISEIGKKDGGIYNELIPLENDIGIIAGEANWLFSAFIPGKDDGVVAIESTKLPEMSDHIVLKVNHTNMMKKKQVLSQIDHFLQKGSFNHVGN